MQRRNAILVLVLSIAGACEEEPIGEPIDAPTTPASAPAGSAEGDGEAVKPEGSASAPATPQVDAPTETVAQRRRRAMADARPRPPAVERTGTEWPFHAWDRAEAVTFNNFVARSHIQLRVYDDSGWVPNVFERKPLDEKLAKRALAIVRQAGGEMKVSKCAFPRHAVVFYSDDVPVASINVCFECGDLLLWPDWSPKEDERWEAWETMSERQQDRALRKQEAFYAKELSRWKVFFRDQVGLEIDESKYR